MEFYSHITKDEQGNITRKKLLENHLREVAAQMERSIVGMPIDGAADVAKAAYLMGISHDFGKFTTYFQRYLLHGSKDGSLHFHGFISAVFVGYVMQKFWHSDKPHETYMPLISYFFVLHHHGNLGSLEDDVLTKSLLKGGAYATDKRWSDKINIFKTQLDDIKLHVHDIEQCYRDLGVDISVNEFIANWEDILRKLDLQRYKLMNKESSDVRIRVLMLGLMMYSELIDNDKMDAAQVEISQRKVLPADIIDTYRMKKFKNPAKPLDEMRNSIYQSVMSSIENAPLSQHLFTLTAPTGSGKTLTGLSAALKLRARIEQRLGYSPRIIYSLPFTSIIDQNYDVIKEILSQMDDFNGNEGLYLVKHHHLSELSYTRQGEEEPLDKALMLIESWQAEIVVTTFIQLFYTLVGYRNKFLKKYHNIIGSIIVLDEIQNVGVEYWPLINKVMNIMASEMGCYIILMTATKPLIFEDGSSMELVKAPEQYFKKLDRVSLLPIPITMTVDEMADKFMDIYDGEHSYLVVMNTIKSSIQLYDLIKDRIDIPILYLSTNIIPKHRNQRIKEIKEHTDRHEPIVVISTQVVEAGVDIDMDVVMRDIGPVDSIIQVAGRCKRSSMDDDGKVYVYKLVDKKDEGKGETLLAKRIYGSIHCMLALKMLERGTISEHAFYDMINEYFNELTFSESQQISDDIWEAFEHLRFSKDESDIVTVSSFSLIDNRPNYADVFIEIDDEARDIWEAYSENVLAQNDEAKRREARLRFKGKLDAYIISVPDKLAMGLQPNMAVSKDKTFWRLPLEGLDLFYDIETGFKRSLDMEVWMA
ncbi:CRISPR-associated helicase/endonuclease Cas3 [Mahella australiensis]|uniref:CRISPR-associated helicase Cas3 n=1 Tax=Mahella australiensis (strain DSM 15567 / CIP 107919 / 50-1 BON) TaxID=697281 RepID=F4A3C0_MAHA5|nr:CRISPR-associated helicase/endonuclease Cas3 [Mahella australiensis]AEE97375.1 CRISPR-associated helicase Cas3 [Mahella australiensis 50-1 BON]